MRTCSAVGKVVGVPQTILFSANFFAVLLSLTPGSSALPTCAHLHKAPVKDFSRPERSLAFAGGGRLSSYAREASASHCLRPG